MPEPSVTRRGVLSGIGAVGVGALAFESGSARGATGDRHIVGTTTPAAARRAAGRARSVRHVLDFGAFGGAVAGQFSDQALEALERNPNVDYIEVDGQMHAIGQELPWGVDRVDAEVAHAEGNTGTGAHIAIIDTGIDSDHPDLNANLGEGKAYVDCKGGPNTCRKPWDDDNDHGTHCAGIADAVNNSEGVVGVSTNATLHALKVLDKQGSGYFSDIAAALEYTWKQGWDVASMSLGASSGSDTVKRACDNANKNGVLVVAAAGNSGPCTDCVGYPAAYDSVIAVSSTTSSDNLSGFSSSGPEVEIAAPGSNIKSTVPGGYATFSGTSMACPHVAGAGGLLMANGETNTQARNSLTGTAEDIGLSSNEGGAGLLDVAAAVGSSTTEPSLSVTTGDATDVTTDSAVLNGTLADLGGADSATVYFEWGESGGVLANQTPSKTVETASSFSESITTLVSGAQYEFRAVAETSAQADTGTSQSFTTESSSTNTKPTASIESVTDSSNPAWSRYTVEWQASDPDDNLVTVLVELLDGNGTVLDSGSTDVSGGSAVGSTEVKARGTATSVRVTATDSQGASGTVSQSV